ncbi:MAG TPA: hypothetical protein VJ233_05500, partial [Hyphomicrobiaceae bacterium]|nr:hypothetical protein [Hyphomicrobiaceae bacterium]
LGAGVVRAAVAATAVLIAAFVVTVAPSRWLEVHCDALSLNLPVLAACGSAGLWAALAVGARPAVRFAIAGASVAIGVGLFAALEPACLAGPFGQVGPALRPVWLDNVMESKSALWLAARYPAATLAFIAFVVAGAAEQVTAWRARPDARTGLAAAFAVLAALLGCWQIKLMPYASWLAVVPLAVFASSLHARAWISAPVMRLAAVLLLSQATLEVGLSALLWPFPRSATTQAADQLTDPQAPCFRSANVRRLAELPPGLIAADVELGPYIVALSPHRVVAAPYHRLERSILANRAILNGPAADALRQLQALGVNYVALCANGATNSARPPLSGQSGLRAQLLGGARVDFLREVPWGTDSPIRVWRIAPAQ